MPEAFMCASQKALSRGVSARRRIAGASLAFTAVTLSTVMTARAGSPRVALDLGTLGGSASYAYAANNSGMVVGYSTLTGNGAYHAFAWTQSGGMTDIGTLGGSNSSAWAVSEQNVVYGVSDHSGDATLHVFSWTPATGIVDFG